MNILLIMRCRQDDSFVFHVLTKDNVTLFIFSVVNKTDALVGRIWLCCVKTLIRPVIGTVKCTIVNVKKLL